MTVTFTAKSKVPLIVETIDCKLEKRRKGIFGPPIGTNLIVFIDDFNMP